jgi:hypothetical protein
MEVVGRHRVVAEQRFLGERPPLADRSESARVHDDPLEAPTEDEVGCFSETSSQSR